MSSAINNAMDKNAYLSLLVTQLKYQDPLQPTDNQQFVAQLAQFSALEQMSNVAQGQTNVLNQLQSMGRTESIGAAFGLLGANVNATVNGNPVAGAVTGISMVNGDLQLKVGNQTILMSDVQSISK